MSDVIEFEIEGLPKRTNNARANWRAKHAEAKKWKARVMKALVCGAKPLPGEPWAKAKLTLIRCSSAEPDFDGLVSSFKHVIDGLIVSGIIQNDKMSNVGIPDYRWEKVSPGKGKIKVRVERAG